jgi:hypothetical protein
MSVFKESVGWKVALRWLLGATALLYVLSRFLPCAPQEHHGIIDDSWMQVLHTAFEQRWQFGRDIVFNFGPWGFLYGGFDPGTTGISITIWAALALIFWWTAWSIARHLFGNEVVAWVWCILFVATSTITRSLNMDVRLTAFVVLLLVLHFFVENKPWSATQVVLTVSLGLLSLVKFAELILAVVVVLAMAANIVLLYRRFPWILLVFGGSVLFFWMLAAQQLSSLIPFFVNSWRMTGSYTEAMMRTRENEIWDVGWFVTAAILLCTLMGAAAWARHRYFGIMPLTGFCFILFAAFKYGYVRHDGHEVTAVSQLLLMSLVCLSLLWTMARKNGALTLAAKFLPVMGMCFFASTTFARYSQTGMAATFARTFGSRDLFAPAKLFGGKKELLEAHQKFLTDYRSKFPLPPIRGSVDVYPLNQAAVLAHGFNYRPRPVIQSYSAQTPELAALNAEFLRGDHAPKNIFFEVKTVDSRFPSLDDGLSWPELLTRYQVMERTGNFVRLQRRAKPSRYKMIPLGESSFEFGTTLNLPSTDAGPIWAEIDITKSLTGKIAAFLFKPPVLWMTTTLKNGRSHPFRIVPAMARGGLLISPLVESTEAFTLLSATNPATAMSDLEVASISLPAVTKSITRCYQSPIRLRLYRLRVSDGDTTSTKN